ncbi:MAG TPA: hypothetical protein PK733_15800 [Clostridiales bacterium]|nr:hypothetical protein [Clostridiales bacterium]
MYKYMRTHRYICSTCIALLVYFLLFIPANNACASSASDYENYDLNKITVVSGIVEDNNPILGYITIYNPDFVENGAKIQDRQDMLRTYNYLKADKVEVLKNHKKSSLESIVEGDTVFIRTDERGYVASVSGVSNCVAVFGKILYKSPDTLIIEYQSDKSQEILKISDNIQVFINGILSRYDDLEEGDRIRLLLHKALGLTRVKEIIVEEGGRNLISNIYKASISYIDDISNRIITRNLLAFEGGKWVRTGIRGFAGFELKDDCNIFYNGREVDTNSVRLILKNSEAYIVAEKYFGGREKIKLISVRNKEEAEVIYDDIVENILPGSERFIINKELKSITYDNQSIVIKDGRLVTGKNISENDTAYIVAGRSNMGDYKAGIIQVYHKPAVDNLQIYRGRIKSINENTDFTVESFSRLDDINWGFNNTAKTFGINFDTRILDEEGLVNQDNFTGYGENSYINRTVYIVANSLDALIISTAPYGAYNIRGEVYKTGVSTAEEENTNTGEPDEIYLFKARVYDITIHKWRDSGEMNLKLLKNSIILKDGKEIKPSDLKKGDSVRVIKKDKTKTGDTYIIFVE